MFNNFSCVAQLKKINRAKNMYVVINSLASVSTVKNSFHIIKFDAHAKLMYSDNSFMGKHEL